MAFIYCKFTNPVYEAKAALLIKDEKKGSEESKMAASLNQISSNVIVENEVEILQSYSQMENMATILHLYAPVVEKARFKSKSACVSSLLIIEVLFPETIKGYINKAAQRS